MSIKDEFMIERHGKQFVLYAGLLDKAHQQGLRSIDTELIQTPGPDNGEVAVCKAIVTMEDGRTFSGIGDASPENVGKNIAPHTIRMSETRSKARALRDAINVSVTAFEELGGPEVIQSESEAMETVQRVVKQVRSETPRGGSHTDAERTPGGATRRAANYLKHLRKQEGESPAGVDEMSARAVKAEIESLKGDA